MNFIKEDHKVYLENENGGIVAEILFPMCGDGIVDITRTFVDESLRGQGVAGKLMDEALQIIKKNGWKAVPTCSYASKWAEKHPEEDIFIY